MISTSSVIPNKYKLPLLLSLIVTGLAGNYFNFEIFLNIYFLFGSIFAMLALQFLGLGRGIVAAAIIAGYTYVIWNHPCAIIIMTAEVAVVGWLMARRKMGLVLADTLFWFITGMRRACVAAMTVIIGALSAWWPIECARAQPVGGKTGERTVLFLGNESLPPMNFMKDGKPAGIAVDLAEALAKRMHNPVEIRLMNWTEAQRLVLADQADALLQINSNKERLKVYDFSEPLLTSEFTIFTSSERVDIASMDDLRGLKVGVEKQGLPILLLRENPQIIVEIIPDFVQGFRMLKTGAVDAVVADRWVGSFVLASNNIHGVNLIKEPIIRSYSAIAVKKGNTPLLKEINSGLADIRRDGTYDRIIKSWQPMEVVFKTREQLRRQVLMIAGVSSALILALVAVLLLAREIRRRKRIEATLLESEERFNLFMDNSPTIAWIKDEQGRHLYFSKTFEERFGLRLEECRGKTDTELWPNEIAEVFRQNDVAILSSGHTVQVTEDTLNPDGSRCYWLSSKFPFQDSVGKRYLGGIGLDITERRQIEHELHVKNVELDRFAYTVSHDLKSPLITIQAYAGMIAKDMEAGKYERAREDIKRIEGAADKMTTLLNDLLELSRAGKMMNEPTEVDMNRVVKDTLAQLAGSVNLSQVEVVVQTDLPAVLGDPKRIAEVVQNLIENAIKYMGDQVSPRIEVGTRQDAKELTFFVSDNGKGIEPRFHEKIFGLFDKLDAKSEGTGVGLALVKRIVEVHGGRVWVESEGEGMGSRFCFTAGP